MKYVNITAMIVVLATAFLIGRFGSNDAGVRINRPEKQEMLLDRNIKVLLPEDLGLSFVNWLESPLAGVAKAAIHADTMSDLNVVGWCLKVSPSTVPPVVVIEAIVQVTFDNHNVALLSLHRCVDGGDGTIFEKWEVSVPVDGKSVRVFKNEPSSAELAAFIRGTNFGYNECDPDVDVVSVVLYKPYAKEDIFDVVRNGIPDNEKSFRYYSGFCVD